MRRVVAIGLALTIVEWSHLSFSACPRSGREYVRLAFTEATTEGCTHASPELVARVTEYVRADLLTQNVDLCDDTSQVDAPPLATVDVEGDCSLHSSVQIRLNDNVTHKQLSRQVLLAGLPRDSHALAISVGAVELLRASWAETRLQGASTAQTVHPVVVERMVAHAPISKRESVRNALALYGVAEAFSGGIMQAGVDLEFIGNWWQRFSLASRLGLRSARSSVARDGRVSEDGWLVGIAGRYHAYVGADHLRVSLVGRVDGMRASFTSVANAKAIASPHSVSVVWPSAGLYGSLRLAQQASLESEVLGGYVLSPVVVTDAGKTVTGFKGGLISARLGVAIHF